MEVLISMIISLVIIGVIAVFVYRIYRKFKGAFREVYGNKSIREVVEQGEWEEQNVPRSVSNATPVYLPQIQRDFPEFSWSEMSLKAKNALKSTLLAMSEHDLSRLTPDASPELKNLVELSITDDNNGGVRTYYDDITVHRIEIWKYIKKDGLCTIQMQAAVGYRMWKVKEGKVIYGSKEKLRQAKYRIDMIYVQDITKLKSENMAAVGINCPNCGAPITRLGEKYCEYCGTGIYDINIKMWKFGAVLPLKD